MAVETVNHTPKTPRAILGDAILSAIDKAIKKRPNSTRIIRIYFLMNCDTFISYLFFVV
jgi:hypothetical protein